MTVVDTFLDLALVETPAAVVAHLWDAALTAPAPCRLVVVPEAGPAAWVEGPPAHPTRQQQAGALALALAPLLGPAPPVWLTDRTEAVPNDPTTHHPQGYGPGRAFPGDNSARGTLRSAEGVITVARFWRLERPLAALTVPAPALTAARDWLAQHVDPARPVTAVSPESAPGQTLHADDVARRLTAAGHQPVLLGPVPGPWPLYAPGATPGVARAAMMVAAGRTVVATEADALLAAALGTALIHLVPDPLRVPPLLPGQHFPLAALCDAEGRPWIFTEAQHRLAPEALEQGLTPVPRLMPDAAALRDLDARLMAAIGERLMQARGWPPETDAFLARLASHGDPALHPQVRALQEKRASR